MIRTIGAEVRGPRSNAIAPLSSAQAGLWFLQQLAPDSPLYNVVHAWRIEGDLDLGALRRALRFVVDRHHALRTTFVLGDHGIGQRVLDGFEPELELASLEGIAPGARAGEALRRATDVGRRTFDLMSGPFLRAFLLRLDARRHWLVLVLHHAIRDGAAMSILCRDLSVAYNAYHKAEAPALAPLPKQFADYAVAQQAALRGAPLEALIAYWRMRLAGAQSVLELPTALRRPVRPSHAGERERFVVKDEIVGRLRALARSEGATLHMSLLAAYQALLARYTNQEDILVGAPVAGRGDPDYESVVGCFINTVVHRGDLSGDPNFRTLLQRTRDSAAQAYAHQALPFERLVEALAPDRDPGRHPLFQALFSLQDAIDSCPDPLLLDGLVATPIDVPLRTSKLDLALVLVRDGARLQGVLEYATDLFTPAWARQFVDRFLSLLRAITADPDRAVSRLPLMSAERRHQILIDRNRTRAPFPENESLALLFEAQARRSPAAVALVRGMRTLSYAELRAQARTVRRRLLQGGVSEGSRVAVCMERSIEEVVASLGVIAAGCAYVPLDPTHPPERLAALVDDAEAAAVLTTPEEVSALAVSRIGSTRPILTLDAAAPLEDGSDAELIETRGGSEPACLMYTSGSTGTPKGAVIPHRAIACLVCGADYVRLTERDVVAHLSNPAFDAASFEIWGALLNGARLAIIDREAVLAPTALAAAFEEASITVAFMTTAVFNQVAREAPRALEQRQILFGGETADPRAVAAALREGHPERLLHVYGPTEATTFATWHEVRGLDPQAAGVSIGRPIANTEVYLLDRHGEIVAPGIPGEIHIGGPGIASGYQGRPDLTAQAFVAHPFSSDPEARLYRTGDLARYDDTGCLEFLGRADRQVKIRGLRIEPGEIEAQLLDLPGVREAVVIVEGETSETRRLSAYVAPVAGATLVPVELGRALRRTLPKYMVPAAIVVVPALPLTANGKLDRRALPRPDESAMGRTGSHVRPRDPLEHQLCAIWEKLLALTNIGIHDGFFDLGGHSLLAAQMMVEVERACGVNVPLTTLLTQSTVAELSTVIRGAKPAAAQPVTALNESGARPPLFFLHGDFNGGGFYCAALARELGREQPFYAVHPHGLSRELPATIEAMAADLVPAIRALRPHGPYLVGGHCNGALVAVEIVRTLVAEGESVPLVIVLDGRAPWRQKPVFESVVVGPALPSSRRTRQRTVDSSRERDDAATRYRRAISRYAPDPIPVRMAVLRSSGRQDLRPNLGWSSLVKSVETRAIRGTHLSSITRHVAETAAQMRECIDRAMDEAGSQPITGRSE